MARFWIFLFVVLFACSKSTHNGTQRTQNKSIEVNLPPRPSLAARQVPEKTPTGEWTVEGFFRHAREMLGSEVTVHGSVYDVKTCSTQGCEYVPHLVLVDDLANPKKKLYVVADPPEVFFENIAEKSKQTFTGKVSLWSPDGRLINLDGLLVVKLTKPATSTTASN